MRFVGSGRCPNESVVDGGHPAQIPLALFPRDRIDPQPVRVVLEAGRGQGAVIEAANRKLVFFRESKTTIF